MIVRRSIPHKEEAIFFVASSRPRAALYESEAGPLAEGPDLVFIRGECAVASRNLHSRLSRPERHATRSVSLDDVHGGYLRSVLGGIMRVAYRFDRELSGMATR